MAPLSLKIVVGEGAVTRTLLFETSTQVQQAHQVVRERILTLDPDKEYGLFLKSADDDGSGVWLEGGRALDYYMLRDGDSLHYLPRYRNLRLRMLDDTIKTLQVDESKKIGDLMYFVCEKIGIANHEEYGFCEIEEQTEAETTKPATGTLTLKRAAHREKDAELQQLIKKFKTDNNVEWLDQHKTLRELHVDPQATLLLKRKLFYSDRNVDARDPLQLNLLYVQTRDAILDGAHVVTEDKAVEFAGIQCQIQYGDFQEEKHKAGFIENLKEFLPEAYAGGWGAEKKVFREHRRHLNLSPVEAKHLYIKMARELPTYGVTFFVVKEKQKGKKKLVPRLLGINSSSILRLDEQTKEILQTWLLTQVKTYKASSETFTLNFGDYSDKEYAVKTNEGYRIKDILESYIDIIRKRLAGPGSAHFTEGEVVMEENVSASRSTTITNYTPQKMDTHSLVGPSQIITVEQGHGFSKGTNVTTVHQIQMSRTANHGQHGVSGIKGYGTVIEELSRDKQLFAKRLNGLNSESVRAVDLLSDPTQENVKQVNEIAETMREALPNIVQGVKETTAKWDPADAARVQNDLDELCKYVNTLAAASQDYDLSDPDKLTTAQDAAKKIADLSTQIYFTLDPKTRRRSKLLLSSRPSFIADERTAATLRRASFITAADCAHRAVEGALEQLTEMYDGPVPNSDEVEGLERSCVDNLGKLNAAVALLLMAHADPQNVDYEMAVNSMKAIHDCVPQLVNDAHALAQVKDDPHKNDLLDRMRDLLDRTKNICMLTGTDDTGKMQEAGNKFADASKKLIFTFGHRKNKKPRLEAKEKEIKDLVMAVGNASSQLLMKVTELSQSAANDPACDHVDKSAVKCADAMHALLTCARITAYSIEEPHCQSALTAAIENLSSSAQNLASSWKPVVEKPGNNVIGIQLTERSLKLSKALDQLKGSYSNLNGDINEEQPAEPLTNKQKKRLKFITTLSTVKEGIDDAAKDLENTKPLPPGSAPTTNVVEAKRRLADKLAQLNAAIASLLQATADPDNHNICRAQRAVDNIRKLTPGLVEEAKLLNGNVDAGSWQALNSYLRSAFEAVNDICSSATDNDGEALKENISKYAKASSKLTFVCNPRLTAKEKDKRGVVELAKLACEQTSRLLTQVYQLAEGVGGEEGQALDLAGAKTVDAAQALLSTAEVTAPSINDPRCQALILSAADSHGALARDLERLWEQICDDRALSPVKDDLRKDTEGLHKILDEIRDFCRLGIGQLQDHPSKLQYLIGDENQRQEYAASITAAKDVFQKASADLANTKQKKRVASPKIDVQEKQRQLADGLALLNAAIASLVQATGDSGKMNVDQAAKSIKDIKQITPDLLNTIQTLNGNIDEDAWKEISGELKNLLDAAKGICDDPNESNTENINDLLSKFANSSGKLMFVFNPNRSKAKEKQVMELSRKACAQTSEMLSKVYHLAEEVGGDRAAELEVAGGRVVAAAQTLLTTAEITKLNLNNGRCRDAIASATNKHIDAAEDLDRKLKEIVMLPECRQYEDDVLSSSRELQDTLDQLRNTFQNDTSKSQDCLPDKQRLKFIASLSNAKDSIDEAFKDLEDTNVKNATGAPKVNAWERQRRLADKLAKLNAAIASLMQATADQHNPDTKLAEAAADTIRRLTPEIVKDIKGLNGNMDEADYKAMTEDLKSLMDAAKDICDNPTNNNKDLRDVAAKYAVSSGRLMFTFNPRVQKKKEKQVLDLSRSACEKTSAMLSKVYELAESVAGDQGQRLDEAGAQVVDDAQSLITTAEVTAPSINDPQCKAALVSAADKQSASLSKLGKTLHPIVEQPQYRQYKDLQNDSRDVQDTLDKLKDLCASNLDVQDNLPNLSQSIADEKQRLKFITSLSAAKNAVGNARRDLKNINRQESGSTPAINVPAAQRRLADKLAQLNAAIASLMKAGDGRNPDVKLAENAMEIIRAVAPDIIIDAKQLSSNVDDRTWKAIAKDLESMLEATDDLCGSTNKNKDSKGINDTLTKFAAASGNLSHVLGPVATDNKEKQVRDLSRLACAHTSAMLADVYQLAEDVGGEEAQALDLAGARVVDDAQTLLTTAQITASYINDALCQASLLSELDSQCSSLKELQNVWRPIVNRVECQKYKGNLDEKFGAVQDTLDTLRDLCHTGTQGTPEQQRQQIISTLSNLKNVISDASKDLENKNRQDSESAPQINVNETQRRLADKLAQLNAAIASLMQATADRENPDTKLVKSATDDIRRVMPDIVKAVKSLDGNMDEVSYKAIEEDLKHMLEATKDISDSLTADNMDVQDVVSKFANASGKLMFTFNPRVKTKKEKQIVDLSRSACEQTSVMLSKVYELAERVGGDQGQQLDEAGSRVIEAAQALLVTAKVTASNIDDNRSKASIVSAVDKQSALAKKLDKILDPIVQKPQNRQYKDPFQKESQSIQDTLDRLRDLCEMSNGNVQENSRWMQQSIGNEQKRGKLATSIINAKRTVDDASKDLEDIKKKAPRSSIHNIDEAKGRLFDKLAKLNAAIAALARATADRENQDLKEAERAMEVIQTVAPDLIRDVKIVSSSMDDKSWRAITEDLKSMLQATSELCESPNKTGSTNNQNTLSKYAAASGNLVHLLEPVMDRSREKQVSDLSRLACEQTSAILTEVYDLAEDVGGEKGQALDLAGAKVVDDAQTLLTTARITAPSIQDPLCQATLLSALDSQCLSAKELENTWQPIVTRPEYNQYKDKLQRSSIAVNDTFGRLRGLCRDTGPSEDKEKQRLELVASLSSSINAIEDAGKYLEDKNTQDFGNAEKINIGEAKRRLADKLAQLDAAVASLMQATGDRENPDTKLAKSATDTIRKVTPDIIKTIKILNEDMDEASRNVVHNDLRSMLGAAKNICSSLTDNNMDVQDTVSKFAKSSDKIMSTFRPRIKAKKEKQVLDLSRSACEKTSVMLSKVYDLGESVGGEHGQKLDAAGSRVIEAAQALLVTAKITATNIDDDNCKASLLSAADKQTELAKKLDKVLERIVQKPQYRQYKDTLQKESQSIQNTLDKLRDLCRTVEGKVPSNLLKMQESIGDEKQRVKFTTKLSTAKYAVDDACRDLENTRKQPPSRTPNENVKETKRRLADRLAQLNAAIAALAQANTDHRNADIDVAENAMDTIRKITPVIVKDVKALNGNVDDKSWSSITEDLKSILEATGALCGDTNRNHDMDMHDTLLKFSTASGHLARVLGPTTKPDKEKQVKDLCQSVCAQTSAMLADVYQLAEDVGGEEAQALDLAGARVGDDAQTLLTTVDVTAPYIDDARCRAALLSALGNQRSLVKQLENTCRPLVSRAPHHQHKENLQRSSHAVQATLGKLKELCQDTASEAERRQLSHGLSSAQKIVQEAMRTLDQTRQQGASTSKINVRETQRRLADKLALLNAALASLLQATADQNTPDVNLAQSSIESIQSAVPAIIEDVKSFSGNVGENFWTVLTDELRTILAATSSLCDSGDKDINTVVYNLGKSSARLMNVVSPRANVKKEKEVLELSRSACEQTSALLQTVYQLSEDVGDEGRELDQTGARLVDAAQTLLSTSKIIAPSINDSRCRGALSSAVDHHSSLATELQSGWAPLLQKKQCRQYADDLQKNAQAVQSSLVKLRELCRADLQQQVSLDEELHVSEAVDNIMKSEKLLADKTKNKPASNKPTTKIEHFDDPLSTQRKLLLAQKLAKLNDAVAKLVQSSKTPGHDCLDQKSAKDAIAKISALLPDIAQDVIALDQTKDSDCSHVVDQIREICKASASMCARLEENDVKGMNMAAVDYSKCSNKLRFILNPSTEPAHINQILESAKSVCERTSALLSRVSQLSVLVEPAAKNRLHSEGTELGDAAQVLLTTAQVTASSIDDGDCRSRLLRSADQLLSSSDGLRATWQPLMLNEICMPIGEQLNKDHDVIQDGVNGLRAAVERVKDIKFKPAIKEKLILTEDSPFKQMAKRILATAQTKSKSSNVPPQEQELLVNFCSDLENALKAFDIANAKCRNQPIDAQRRGELEAVIQNIQQMCLFSKDLTAEESFIVDLANYVNDVLTAAEEVIGATKSITPTAVEVKEVQSESQIIIKEATHLLRGETEATDPEITNDLLKYDHYGKSWEDRVKNILVAALDLPESKSTIFLREKVQALKENTDLFRFAAKCNLSTAMGVSVDETLENLSDLEAHVQDIIKPVPGAQNKQSVDVENIAVNAQEALISSLVSSDNVPKAFAEYTLQMRSTVRPDKEYNSKLKDHLKRLAQLLKSQVAVRGRLVATWQDEGAETTAITDQIIQELDSFNNEGGLTKRDSLAVSNEYKNLLMPRNTKITGDNKVLLDRFQKAVNKLSIDANTLVLGSQQPESLSRCVNLISETASQLASTAQSVRTESPVAEKQTQEAAQNMCRATYKMLKVAQSLQRTSNKADGRRRLQEACRLLNDSINRLVRTVLPRDKERECHEMSRQLQMQGAFLRAQLPATALGYKDCLDALHSQQDVIHKLKSDQGMTKGERYASLGFLTSAVNNAVEYATQTAYLLSLSKEDRNIVEHGLVDVARQKKLTENLRDGCIKLLYCGDGEQIKHIKSEIGKDTELLQKCLDDDSSKVDQNIKAAFTEDMNVLKSAVKSLQDTAHSTNEKNNMISRINCICKVVDGINRINGTIDKIEEPRQSSQQQTSYQEIIDNTRDLVGNMSALAKKSAACDDDGMTWVVFGGNDVVRTFDKLVQSIRQKGIDAEIIASPKQEDVPTKSYIQIQVDLAKKWLQHPAAKPDAKNAGIKGITYAIEMAEKIAEDLNESEREDMKHLVNETKSLLKECTQKYNSEKASLLLERLKELRKMLERGVVIRVVEDFLQNDHMVEMEAVVAKEQDKNKRKYILERKLLELKAQLGKVTQTARLVADTGSGQSRRDLMDTSNKVELLAPSLVQAAQTRYESPENKGAIEEYVQQVEQYARVLSSLRELCDRAVDPIDFAQAAGDTMQRIKEERMNSGDPQACRLTSNMILRLGNRVVDAGMNSAVEKKDSEMHTTLSNIKKTIDSSQAEQQSDWKAIFAEILQKTSQVESVLGGENIFNKEPQPNQPIFAAALDLHAAIREWSARDNDIVACAKRMAVLMAKLSHSMETDNTRELIFTSKEIVSKAEEVAALARKLALECTDMRIRTNLLQVCDKIPTIGGQLKILTTVKGSSLGHQGSAEDKEAMNMLVCNAQNLMTSIQEVVKAAASASVKIMSQRGSRMKWVRRQNYWA